jgi:peptidoglycan hydrolase-like protein with peptidoglycan-binding domain
VNENNQVVIHVIEGNNPSKVARNEYLLSDPTILGYGTVTDAAEVTMRPGNKGEKVRQLQTRLEELTLMQADDMDGVFGGKTTAAIRTFQQDYMPGKHVNGIADMETQFAMQDEIENRLDNDPANWVVAGD